MKVCCDILVVGAGSAGAAVASRLSEDPTCHVVLVEAGDWPGDPDISNPLKWPELANRSYDWAYRTQPQPHTAHRIHEWPRGRLVGGSSCINAMAHVRGHPDDFDAWAQAGGDEWSYRALLPAFIRSESFQAFQSPEHGCCGPLDVYLPDAELSPVARSFIEAGKALGAPALRDHNSGHLVGCCPNSLNIRAGQRVSVANAYLSAQVIARQNLTILTGHEVSHFKIQGHKAGKLIALNNGHKVELLAEKIILSGGAIATPLILMRSGIGDPAELKNAGIACQIASCDVGCNLQDHLLGLGNIYTCKQAVPTSQLQHSESLMYLNSDNLSASLARPDIVLACVIAPSAAPGLPAPPYGNAFTILFGGTAPTSRGRISLSCSDPNSPPIIDPCYLQTENDRATLRRAFRLARKIGHSQALSHWRDEEVLPGPIVQSDAEIDAFIAHAVCTHHHPCGTCRMGRDGKAVVSPDLKLNGLDNVYVVDASIIPQIPSGPINAAVVAIAEKWASTTNLR